MFGRLISKAVFLAIILSAIFFGIGLLGFALAHALVNAFGVAVAYAIVVVAVSPYLYYFFQPGLPRSPVNSPAGYSADLLNFIIPTPSNAIGMLSVLPSISRQFAGAIVETGAWV